jgi:hypothetical protein
MTVFTSIRASKSEIRNTSRCLQTRTPRRLGLRRMPPKAWRSNTRFSSGRCSVRFKSDARQREPAGLRH